MKRALAAAVLALAVLVPAAPAEALSYYCGTGVGGSSWSSYYGSQRQVFVWHGDWYSRHVHLYRVENFVGGGWVRTGSTTRYC